MHCEWCISNLPVNGSAWNFWAGWQMKKSIEKLTFRVSSTKTAYLIQYGIIIKFKEFSYPISFSKSCSLLQPVSFSVRGLSPEKLPRAKEDLIRNVHYMTSWTWLRDMLCGFMMNVHDPGQVLEEKIAKFHNWTPVFRKF